MVLRHLWSAERTQRSATSVEELDRARQDLARLLMPLSAATQELQDKKQSQDNLDKVRFGFSPAQTFDFNQTQHFSDWTLFHLIIMI